MRVLHVCSSIDPVSGGPANVLARLAPIQREQGHHVDIVVADAPEAVKEVVESLADAGVAVHAGGSMSGPFAKGPNVERLLRKAFDRKPDVVHIHGIWQHAPHTCASMARHQGVPYIFRPCGMLDPWCLEQSKWVKKAHLAFIGRRDFNGACALHYTTETERRLVMPLGFKATAYVIPNGLDTDEFDPLPEPGAFRAAHGLADAPIVIYLSRLHPKKLPDLLIRAFAKGASSDARLVLAGAGEDAYVRDLQECARVAGVADRTIFTGMITGREKIEALADANLFCLPSQQENFGVVVIEALAAGTPVLISEKVNIFREVLDAGAGRAEPVDEDRFAAALREMLHDRERLREMGRIGHLWVIDTFDWRSIGERIDTMYREVVP